MASHTPGPWRASPGEDNTGNDADCTWGSIIGGPQDLHIAQIWGDVGAADANARLIAAAPDLLAALRDLLDVADDDGLTKAGTKGFVAIIRAARAAIAKATGEAP